MTALPVRPPVPEAKRRVAELSAARANGQPPDTWAEDVAALPAPDPDTVAAIERLARVGPPPAGAPVLDDVALHGLAGEWVELVNPCTESDPAARLAQFLAAFGNAVGPKPHMVADGTRHRARLFVVVVGDSAKARKGTSWAHVRTLMALVDRDWEAQRVTGGLSSGEGLIEAVADPMLDKDGNQVGGVTDKRLFLNESEFSRVLTAGGRDGSTLSEVIRQAWDLDRLATLTRKPVKATGAHITIAGHIVMEELRQKLTATDRVNGFANRFLFVHARRYDLLPESVDVDQTDLEAVAKEVRRRLDRAKDRQRVDRTPAARERWAELYTGPLAKDCPPGLVGALVARAEAQVLRLSLTYALVAGAAVVDVEHLDAAYALWRYCRGTVDFVFADKLGDLTADRLLEAIRAAGVKGLDGTAQSEALGRNVKAAEIARGRKVLEDAGLAYTVAATDGTRRFTTYATNTTNSTNKARL